MSPSQRVLVSVGCEVKHAVLAASAVSRFVVASIKPLSVD